MNKFRGFIVEQLRHAGMDKDLAEHFTQPRHISMFKDTFNAKKGAKNTNTHKLGVKVLISATGQLLMNTYSNIKAQNNIDGRIISGEGIYTMLQEYCENVVFTRIAKDNNFNKYIHFNQKLHDKLLKNIFKSFLGTLIEIVEEEYVVGTGYIFVYKYLSNLMSFEQFPPLSEIVNKKY